MGNLQFCIQRLAQEMLQRDVYPLELVQFRGDRRSALGKAVTCALDVASDLLCCMDANEVAGVAESVDHYYTPGFDVCGILRGEPAAVAEGALAYLLWKLSPLYSPLRDELVRDPSCPSHVLCELPEIEGCFDEDGLLILDRRFTASEYGIVYGKWFIHYSQFLRRGFSARPNFDFLGRLSRLCCQPHNLDVRVAIDHRRLMNADQVRQISEFDYWRGPKLGLQLLDDRSAVGLTVHGRASDARHPEYDHVIRTEFRVCVKDNIKRWEIEEVDNPDDPTAGFVINKYIHSTRPLDGSGFNHLDGAVRIYKSDGYEARLSDDLSKMSKHTVHAYRKQFRVDGSIPDMHWAELVTYYYRGNELVQEYIEST